jgi:hypothetical protein
MGAHAGQDGKCFPGEAELGERVVYSERQVRRGVEDLRVAGYLRITKEGRKNVYWGELPSSSNSQNGGSVASPPVPAVADPGVRTSGTSGHGATSSNGSPSEERIEGAKGWIIERLTSLGPLEETKLQAELDPWEPQPWEPKSDIRERRQELRERRQAVPIALQRLLVEKKITQDSRGAYRVAS